MNVAKNHFRKYSSTTRLVGGGAILCLIAAAALIVVPALRSCLDWPRLRAQDIHYLFDYVPRFRQSECIVRFEFEAPSDVGSDVLWHVTDAARETLTTHDPIAALFQYKFQRGPAGSSDLYMMFFDDCDRLDSIAQTLLSGWRMSHPGLAVTLDMGPHAPGPDTVTGDGNWLDSPSYDAHPWQLRRRAHAGDGEALLAVARLSEGDAARRGDPATAYLYYFAALQRLDDPDDVAVIERQMAASFESIQPIDRETYRSKARRLDAAIRFYGEGDNSCPGS